jgi:hypothetical protein
MRCDRDGNARIFIEEIYQTVFGIGYLCRGTNHFVPIPTPGNFKLVSKTNV